MDGMPCSRFQVSLSGKHGSHILSALSDQMPSLLSCRFDNPRNSEPTTSRKRPSDDCDSHERWPKRPNCAAANVVHASGEGFWHEVDHVDVGSSTYLFREHSDATYKLILSSNTFIVFNSTREFPVECKLMCIATEKPYC